MKKAKKTSGGRTQARQGIRGPGGGTMRSPYSASRFVSLTDLQIYDFLRLPLLRKL